MARRARPLQMTPAPIRHRPHALVGSDIHSPRNHELQEPAGPGAVEGERGGSAPPQDAVGMAAVDGAGAKRPGHVRSVSHAGRRVSRRSAAAVQTTLRPGSGAGAAGATGPREGRDPQARHRLRGLRFAGSAGRGRSPGPACGQPEQGIGARRRPRVAVVIRSGKPPAQGDRRRCAHGRAVRLFSIPACFDNSDTPYSRFAST